MPLELIFCPSGGAGSQIMGLDDDNIVQSCPIERWVGSRIAEDTIAIGKKPTIRNCDGALQYPHKIDLIRDVETGDVAAKYRCDR